MIRCVIVGTSTGLIAFPGRGCSATIFCQFQLLALGYHHANRNSRAELELWSSHVAPSAVDPHGSELIWRSRIRIGNADPEPDPGAWKLTKNNK
jgi:hypothetical protein